MKAYNTSFLLNANFLKKKSKIQILAKNCFCRAKSLSKFSQNVKYLWELDMCQSIGKYRLKFLVSVFFNR